MTLLHLLCGTGLGLLPGLLFAAAPPAPTAEAVAAKQALDSLKFQEGNITLKDGLAKITLPPAYRYLDPQDAETLLTKIWGNPAGPLPLGMIVPGNFGHSRADDWAIVLQFAGDGYVKDDDAAAIDYDKLMADMKAGVADENKGRVQQGYPAIDLVGWAAPPHYDAATHKLYWAKDLKIANRPDHTLNYNIRLLGRDGVLVLNVVAGVGDLPTIEQATPTILSMVNFQEGHRYADYKPGTDKVAAYGIAALVAGGVAAKAGLFKALWIGLLAFKKIIIVGFMAVVGFLKKFYNRITGRAGPASAAKIAAGGAGAGPATPDASEPDVKA